VTHRRLPPKIPTRAAAVLASLCLLLVLPLYADDTVQIVQDPQESPAFPPDIINGLITSDYPTVGVILEGTRENNYSFCTGTLIGCNTFLTAAHCLCANFEYCDDHDVSTGFVYFANGGVYGISAVDIHPDFSAPTADVAVVTLSEPVTGITPTPINDVAPTGLGDPGTIVGYGLSNLRDYTQGVKYFGHVRTAGCDADLGFTDENNVCWIFRDPVGDPGEDSNTCHGDSGGPLFVDMAVPGASAPNVVVAGITSGGYPSCGADSTSFDSNVYTYRQFIQDVAGDDLGTGSCGDLPPVGTPETIVASADGTLDLFHNTAVHVFQVPPDLDLLRITMNASDMLGQNFYMTVNQGSPSEDGAAACVHDDISNWAICEFEDPVAGDWYATVQVVDLGGEYQVTATMFGNRPNSGQVYVRIDPSTDAVSPGGDLPYTVEVRNVTDEFQNTMPQWRIQSASGQEYLFGPYDVPLAPGEVWTHEGRIGFSSGVMPGPWTMIVETTGEDGSYDSDWTAFSVQTEHAVDVRLSSDTALVRPGDTWAYTAELQNVVGRPLTATAVWTITDPDGVETAYGPYAVALEAGEAWRRDLTVGHFPESPVGVWTLTVETTAEGFVDRDSLEVELVPFGVAQLRRLEEVWDARDITPDGRIIVGNFEYGGGGATYLWSEATGVVPLPGEGIQAQNVSDDGSVVLAHVRHPSGLTIAARWTETLGWRPLPLLDENVATCGGSWSHAYDMTPDGGAVVGLGYRNPCDPYAFRWTEETGTVALPKTGRAARANAISDDGTVVAGFDEHPDYGIRRGAYWVADDPSDPFTTFTESIVPNYWMADLYPGDFVPADGIGEILSMTPDASFMGGDTHLGREDEPECPIPGGFRWNPATDEFAEIWAYRDCWGAWPVAMAADGRIVVGATGPYTAPVRVGMIWTEATGLVLLEEFVRSLGADLAGLSYLGFATDITEDGRTIVGVTPGEGAWIITLPAAEDLAAAGRAGTGRVVVQGGVPVQLPAGKETPVVRPEPRVDAPETERPTGTVDIQMKK